MSVKDSEGRTITAAYIEELRGIAITSEPNGLATSIRFVSPTAARELAKQLTTAADAEEREFLGDSCNDE